MTTLLEDLKVDAVWEKVKVEWPANGEEVRPIDTWSVSMTSTTNTLAALLKVSAPRWSDTIARERLDESTYLAFARDLLTQSSALLANFDAISAKQ